MRESFIFYKSFYEAIEELDDKKRLKMYDSICKLALKNEKIDDLNGICKQLFVLIEPQISANNKRYEDGKKGGRPANKKTSGFFEKKPNENVNENVNEKEKKEKENFQIQNFQNSDFEKIEINEINETKMSYSEIPKSSKTDNNTLLEEEKREGPEINSATEEVCNIPPPQKNKENDPYFFYNKVRAVYEDIIGKQGVYLNDMQVHELYRLYLSTDDFMDTLNDTLKELLNVRKIFKKKIGYSPGLDWIIKADGKNYTTLRNKSFTGLEEEKNKENEVFQIAI